MKQATKRITYMTVDYHIERAEHWRKHAKDFKELKFKWLAHVQNSRTEEERIRAQAQVKDCHKQMMACYTRASWHVEKASWVV